jgi:hypothetical protein
MISSLKLPFEFDARKLLDDADKFTAADWTPHFNTQYYEGDWSGIPLRAARNAHVSLYPDPVAKDGYENTDYLARCAYIPKVLESFACELESVRFLRLGGGAKIREHRDYKLSFEDGAARFHIPVKTSPQVEFFLDKKHIQMEVGEAWYLNLNLPHSVNNHGADARIHLVIDCIVNDWLSRFFV